MDRLSRLAVALLLTVSFSSHADYWSLASFSSQENGMKELARVSSIVPEAVLAASGDQFRVLVEKSSDADAQKRGLESAGFWPWTVYASQVGQVFTNAGTQLQINHYLVAGSFSNEPAAQRFMRKLQADGRDSVEVQIAEVSGTVHYRVIQGPYSDRTMADTDLQDYGIDRPWWLTVTVQSIVAESAGDAINEPPEQTTSVESIAVEMEGVDEPVYTITPPAADEDYLHYCLHKANAMERAIYCNNTDFNRIAAAQIEAEGDSEKSALLKCALQSRDGQLQECRD